MAQPNAYYKFSGFHYHFSRKDHGSAITLCWKESRRANVRQKHILQRLPNTNFANIGFNNTEK